MYTRQLAPPKKSFFLLAPRGTGKSTWIKSHFKSAKFYDLLDSSETLRLSRKPSLLYDELNTLKPASWVVIDEIQKIPELLNEVHRLIENHKLNFVLSGSSARKLRRQGVNLLAGRAITTHLYPLVSAEMGHLFDAERALQFGTLPLSVLSDEPKNYLRSYVDTYLHEEIKAEALTRNFGAFARFLEVAGRQNGQVTNTSSIARDAQVARPTVQGYFEILVDTLLGYWLEPWKLKRKTKQVAHSKFYFFDSGVARALSGRLAYPLLAEEKGPLFESWILNELRAYLSYRNLHYSIHFWSSHDGVEVDFLIEDKNGFVALELKATDYWETKFNRGLMRIQDELRLKGRVRASGVFMGKRRLQTNDGVTVYPVTEFLKRLWAGEVII